MNKIIPAFLPCPECLSSILFERDNHGNPQLSCKCERIIASTWHEETDGYLTEGETERLCEEWNKKCEDLRKANNDTDKN